MIRTQKGISYILRDARQACLGHQRQQHPSIKLGYTSNFHLLPSLKIQCLVSCLLLAKSKLGGLTDLPRVTGEDRGACDSVQRTSVLFPLGMSKAVL